MTEAEALALFVQMITLPDNGLDPLARKTIATSDPLSNKNAVMAMCAAASFDITTLLEGDPTERWIEIMGRGFGVYANVSTAALQGLLIVLATDPGDVGPLGPDPSLDQTPRPGMLSALGAGGFFTERNGARASTSSVTIKNNGTSPTTPFLPGALSLDASTLTRADGGVPYFTNTADASIYTGIGGTLPPLAPAASVTIPVQSVGKGSYYTAGANLIDTVVTQSYGALIVTSSTSAVGRDREPRLAYIARCQRAPSRLAKGGTVDGVEYASTTQDDATTGLGTALLNYLTGDPVTILGALVIPDSSSNTITAYFYGAGGPVALASDIASANGNIQGVLLDNGAGVNWNPDPLGIVPETVSYTGSDSIATAINVIFSARMNASDVPGGAAAGAYTYPGTGNMVAVFTQISDYLTTWIPAQGPGGQDAVAGVGKIWTSSILVQINVAVPALRDVLVTTPGGASTAIVLGHVGTLGVLTSSAIVVV